MRQESRFVPSRKRLLSSILFGGTDRHGYCTHQLYHTFDNALNPVTETKEKMNMYSKKSLYCMGIVVVIFVCVLAVFLSTTGSVTKTAMDVNLTGNWRILIKDNSPASVDSSLCFDGTQMTYTPGNGEAEITDTYEMNEKGFSLTNLRLSFSIAKKTDNLLKLSGSDGRFWYVLKISEQPKLITPMQVSLDRNWDVVVHGNNVVSETMIVKNDRVTFYKDSVCKLDNAIIGKTKNLLTPYFSWKP